MNRSAETSPEDGGWGDGEMVCDASLPRSRRPLTVTRVVLSLELGDLKRVVIHVADRTANSVGKLYTSAQPG